MLAKLAISRRYKASINLVEIINRYFGAPRPKTSKEKKWRVWKKCYWNLILIDDWSKFIVLRLVFYCTGVAIAQFH